MRWHGFVQGMDGKTFHEASQQAWRAYETSHSVMMGDDLSAQDMTRTFACGIQRLERHAM
eukprot:1158741-Pelagomonas_calceolata.AAC.6